MNTIVKEEFYWKGDAVFVKKFSRRKRTSVIAWLIAG